MLLNREKLIFFYRKKIKYSFILSIFINFSLGCSLELNDQVPEKKSNEIIKIQENLKKQEKLLVRLQALIADQIIYNNDLEQAIPPRDLLESLQNLSIELQKKTKTLEEQLSKLQKDFEKFESNESNNKTIEKDLDYKLMRGLISLQAGDPGTAKEYFQEIISDRKKTKMKGKILMAIGHSFLSQDLPKQAAAHYGIFLREYPKNAGVPQALFYLGKAMEKLCEKKKMKVIWNDLIEKFPNSHFSKRVSKLLMKTSSSK